MSALIGDIGALLMVALIAMLGMRVLHELGIPMDSSMVLRAGLGSAAAALVWQLLIGCFLTWENVSSFIDPLDVPELWRGIHLLAANCEPFSGYAALLSGALSFIHAMVVMRVVCPEKGDAGRLCCLLFCTPIGLMAFLPCTSCIVWSVACAVLCALRRGLRVRIRLGGFPDAPISALLLILTTAWALKINI